MLLPVLSKDTAANLIRNESKVYLHYMPYGELWRNQRRTGYDERYKFTGKERDAETGYDYYPARYLWGSVGIWLSVDPLAGKYPWITPYAYCAWNPVKFVDPDGWVVIATNPTAQMRLLGTLSCSERRFVSFNKNGKLNVLRLMCSTSKSHNMTALKALSKSKIAYNVLVLSNYNCGE